jgi:RNA polymerase sigma factor (sigma-70 family)
MTVEDALAQVQRHITVSADVIARRYQHAPRAWDASDLRQEGTLAAVQAWPRFDPTRGATWHTFVDQRITGAMWDFVRTQQHRHPDEQAAARRQLVRTTRQLTGWRQRAPERQLEARHDLARPLGRCTATERTILEAHADGERLHAIGARLGVSESRVSQIRTAALTRLRRQAA